MFPPRPYSKKLKANRDDQISFLNTINMDRKINPRGNLDKNSQIYVG